MLQTLDTLYFSKGDLVKVQVASSMNSSNSAEGWEDLLYFSVKKNLSDEAPVLQKSVAVRNLMEFIFTPEETGTMAAGYYFYDLRLRLNGGEVTTLCLPSKLEILEVVGNV